MEFVGRTITKEFKGFGVFTGEVKSYDSSLGFFEIGYEDGDSEEIDYSELAALLEVDGVSTDHSPSLFAKKPSRVGRRPRKRRRVLGSLNSGNGNAFSSSVGDALSTDDSNLGSVVEVELKDNDNFSKNLDFSSKNNNNVSNNCQNVNSNDGGLDLNCGLHDLDTNNGKANDDAVDLNLDMIEENDGELKGKEIVDKSVKKELCNFDLNMDLDDHENKNQDIDLGGYLKGENSSGEFKATPTENASLNASPVLDSHGNLGKTYPGRRGRKRRNHLDTPNTAAESVLRRSARRRAKLFDEDVESSLPKIMDLSAVSEDRPTISECEESEDPTILPPKKLELPPSSKSMNLDGLPVIDLISVYAFLRSFSTLIFLSPFEFGDFVASIRSTSPSLLIDSIHVSLLRALRKHLEFQSSENSTSSTNCLRDLNWDLLDVITWPIFMIEYLLTKPDFDLTHLKLHKTDYYKQPEFVKVEILHYLCDDVIEVEAISSELTRRSLVGEYTTVMDTDQPTKLVAVKSRRVCTSEEGIEDTADWNSDECCLCKMDGNLICCDGCPAAFHSKCVGVATSFLPEGNWFCPECVVDKKNGGINVAKAIRGAELLGVDPDGRAYYSSCGYVLVSDPSDAETSYHYYHMDDSIALINALNLLNDPYWVISNAITKNACLYNKLCVSEEKDETVPEEKPPVSLSAQSSEISEGVSGNHNLEIGYLNLYSFARVASSVAGDWARKYSNKTSQTPTKSLEDLISVQMKSISKTSVDFFWSNIRNLSLDARKEKCGWCLACKFPTDDGDCLFFMNNASLLESFTSDGLGFGSRMSQKDRLVDVMCHIVFIEDRLHGLLLGPWLNPHFPKLYRKSFLEASDIVPVKDLLLMLESNLRLRALSEEWLKHVDSVVTVGSASLIVTSKHRNVIGRKRSYCNSGSEPRSSKNAASGLGLYWWRGGKLTRQLFNWKVLPRSLASIAARKGGGTKIDGILYPENSDFPKRSKALAWRAAVQSAVTVEQLALQVRELDANIKWEEIENTSHLAKMDKESIKFMRSFKKAIIRRKSSEGSTIKYLLDFGKRRFIPDTVVKLGSKLEDSSGRKKYWVDEAHVPLFLLKAFEDRRIAFKSNKTSPGKLPVIGRAVKPAKDEGFAYLFAKAEKSENRQCGQCNKDVPIKDAVSCQYCEGFFHKRHARMISGGASEKCMYTCHKCHVGETLKISPKKGRKTKKASNMKTRKISKKSGKGKQSGQSQSNGRGFVVPLRRSARTAKIASIQTKKKQVKKKKQPKKKQLKSIVKKKEPDPDYDVKQPKRKRGRPRKIKKDSFQKKRTQMRASYWLNGLLLSGKPDDERVMDFRTRNHLARSELVDSISDRPKCCLCHEPEFRSSLNYINCETCGDWYHGDAFGLKDEHIQILIGFKCHKCRERAPPVCLHLHPISNESKSGEQKNDVGLGSKDRDVANAQNGLESGIMEPVPGFKDDNDMATPQNGLESAIMEHVPDFKDDDDVANAQNGLESGIMEPVPGFKDDDVANAQNGLESGIMEPVPGFKDDDVANAQNELESAIMKPVPDFKDDDVANAQNGLESGIMEPVPGFKDGDDVANAQNGLESGKDDDMADAQNGPESGTMGPL